MKKYLTKWVMTICPDKPENSITYVELVKPNKINGTVGYEVMMVANEAWVKKNLGDIELKDMELPEIFDKAQLCGEEE